MNALGEKSNQVRDSLTLWVDEQADRAAAASSNAAGSRATGVSSARSHSNSGGSASRATGSAGGSQSGASSSGQSYWVETQTEDPSLGYNCTLKTNGSTTCHDNSGNQIYKDGQWSNGNANGRWTEGGR